MAGEGRVREVVPAHEKVYILRLHLYITIQRPRFEDIRVINLEKKI